MTRLCAHGLGDGADAAVVEGAPLVHRQAGWGEGWRDGPAQVRERGRKRGEQEREGRKERKNGVGKGGNETVTH